MKDKNNQPTYNFGTLLRQVRERRGLTLREVAGKAEVSESLVSQIERNLVSPSIDTLMNLAEILEVDLDYLFKDYRRKKGARVIRRSERKITRVDGAVYESISVLDEEDPEHSIKAFFITLGPHSSKASPEFGHRGRELGVLIEGEGELEYGTKQYYLQEGDSVQFSSDIPHVLKNTGEEELKALWISSPQKNRKQQ